MNTKTLSRSSLYVLWAIVLVWGVVFANNIIYPVISRQMSSLHVYVNDILSDAVYLFVAFMPVVWAPKFFGYQLGAMNKYWKMLLGMTAFFCRRTFVVSPHFRGNTIWREHLVL